MQAICLTMLFLVVIAFGQSDIEALLELKKGFVSDPSGQVLVSWNSKSLDSNGGPRNWYGIACNGGRVTLVTVNDVGLAGEFRFSTIIGLSMLSSLPISNNMLTGTISKIDSLQSVQNLDLSCNLFHGSIPPGLVKLKKLAQLNLSSNQFEGNVPDGFGKLQQPKKSLMQRIKYMLASSVSRRGRCFCSSSAPIFVRRARSGVRWRERGKRKDAGNEI